MNKLQGHYYIKITESNEESLRCAELLITDFIKTTKNKGARVMLASFLDVEDLIKKHAADDETKEALLDALHKFTSAIEA